MTKPHPSDFPASIVVFLIALPLSMGIAMASGVPPALGLVTAVIGGLVVGTMGGAHLQISGPSAGLAVLIAELVGRHGMAVFALIVIMAGVMQLLSGLGKVGRLFQAVSPAVVRGMLTGIGILIIASQFHVMIDDNIHESGLRNLLMIPSGLIKAFTNTSDTVHMEAAIIGVSTLLVTVGWDKLKKGRLKMIPGPLLGVTLGACLAAVFSLPIRYVAVPASLLELIHLPSLSTLSELRASVLFDAIGLAFVASAETLLCATAVARMHQGPRTDYNRELVAHGVANTLCGVVGVLPITGVISRSTANVQANAETRYAAIFHAVWIGSVVLLLPGLLALVPMSSLAAVLVYIGFKLLNIPEARTLYGYGRLVFIVFVATVVGVVAVDLLSGILIGLGLSALLLMYRVSHLEFTVTDHGGRVDVDVVGAATFMTLPQFSEAFDYLPKEREIHLHIEHLTFIDHSCVDRIGIFKEAYESNGGVVIVEWDDLVGRYKKGFKMGQAPDRSPTSGAVEPGPIGPRQMI